MSKSPQDSFLALACAILLTAFSACSREYCDETIGTMGSRIDSLYFPVGFPATSTLPASFAVGPIAVRWPTTDNGTENTGGGFVPWLRQHGQHVFLLNEGTTDPIYCELLIDSINPFLDNPRTGKVSGILSLRKGDVSRRLMGNIEASLPMDTKIQDGVPFSYVIHLQDGSGIALVLRDSANVKRSQVYCDQRAF